MLFSCLHIEKTGYLHQSPQDSTLNQARVDEGQFKEVEVNSSLMEE